MNEQRPTDSPTDSPFIDYKEVDILEHSRVSDNTLLKSTLGPSPDFHLLPPLSKTIDQELDQHSGASTPQEDAVSSVSSILNHSDFEEQLKRVGLTLDDAAECIDEVPLAVLEEAAAHQEGNFNLEELARINPFRMTEALESSLYRLAENTHGTRVVQRLIESVEADGELLIACEIESHIKDLIFNQNGNHCVSRIFEHFSEENIAFAIEECADAFMAISRHCHGCCIIQKCISRSGDVYPRFFELAVYYATEMVMDEYANFVYQCVLDQQVLIEHYGLDSNELINPLIPMIYELSLEKASSHVAEKIVEYAHGSTFERLQEQILSDKKSLISMSCDRFGNYVVERILERGASLIANGLYLLKSELRGEPYAKFILNFLGE